MVLSRFLPKAALAVVIAATLGSLPDNARAASDDRRGGSITVVHATEPARLIPLDDAISGEISSKIVDGLVTFDLDFTPRPELATEWTVSPDGLVYTFKLREGVKWHDGKDFTAEDAAFSIRTLKERHPRGRLVFANVSDIEATAPHTLTLRLTKPAPYLLKALVSSESPIVPKHIFDGSDVATNPARRAPIGTGPFIFKEWVSGSHILLERNPNYWNAPKPYLDRIVIRFLGDPGARTAGFEANEIDLGGNSQVPAVDLDRLISQNPDLAYTTDGYAYYGYQTQAVLNLRSEPLGKHAVRQAIAHAIDIDTFLSSVWYGRALLSPTPITPRLAEFHDPSIKHHAFDVAKAEALLDEAGYPRKADGTRFSLRITYNPYLDYYRRAAEFFSQALRKVGIDARVDNYDYATFVVKVYTEGAFDISLEGLINLFDPTVGAQRVYWSKNIKPGVAFSNASNYANPEVDTLLEAAASENDPLKRVEYFKQFQQIIHRDLPAINLVSNDLITVYNKKVKDHTTLVNGIYGNLADAYIDEQDK